MPQACQEGISVTDTVFQKMITTPCCSLRQKVSLHGRCITTVLAVAIVACSSGVHAGVILDIVQSGNDVVGTLSGSITSLVGATPSGSTTISSYNFVTSGYAYVGIAPTNYGHSEIYDNYDIPTFPANFGTSDTTAQIATASTASTSMWLNSDVIRQLRIVSDYTLGTPVTGTITWSNKTLAGLGLGVGTYVYAWTGDSFTVNVTAVPEPASAVIALAGVLGFGLWRKNR